MPPLALPTLRQFIIKAIRHGCLEREIEGHSFGARGPFKGRYLVRQVGKARLLAILPNVRESDALTETVFESLVRSLALESVRDELR
jgi:hypothetical protein